MARCTRLRAFPMLYNPLTDGSRSDRHHSFLENIYGTVGGSASVDLSCLAVPLRSTGLFLWGQCEERPARAGRVAVDGTLRGGEKEYGQCGGEVEVESVRLTNRILSGVIGFSFFKFGLNA